MRPLGKPFLGEQVCFLRDQEYYRLDYRDLLQFLLATAITMTITITIAITITITITITNTITFTVTIPVTVTITAAINCRELGNVLRTGNPLGN